MAPQFIQFQSFPEAFNQGESVTSGIDKIFNQAVQMQLQAKAQKEQRDMQMQQMQMQQQQQAEQMQMLRQQRDMQTQESLAQRARGQAAGEPDFTNPQVREELGYVLSNNRPGLPMQQNPMEQGLGLAPKMAPQQESPIRDMVRSYIQKQKKSQSMGVEEKQADIDLKKANAQRALNPSKPPAGYAWGPDGNSLVPIPGGPAEQKIAKGQSDKDAALRLYETAREGLISGLSGSRTGPLSGRVPAVTSKQQIAEGAVAAMAPVLKQLFRVSGEGVFTDRDQQLLLDMIPTRKTNPDAITAQIENIDRIVKAKLNQSPTGAKATPAEEIIRSMAGQPREKIKAALKAAGH